MWAVKTGLCLCFAVLLKGNPVVHAPWGTVIGITNITEDWTNYHAFLGIPFALPPVGVRRFSRPVPHPGFNYTFRATSYGPVCIQTLKISGMDGVDGDEDCLTLNIFTPASLSEFSRFPVMVWIHGGGFVIGNALMYDGSPIVARGDVVFVTIQYRLGPFGFLSTGDSVAKGNYGLWDQHLALQWVKKNIGSFGGDANKITIIGESAGSASVAFHALYPGSKGLFQRTIMQSGSVTSTWAYNRNPLKDTMTLAKKLNCLPSGRPNHVGMIHCLRQASAKSIADVYWPTATDPITTVFNMGFVPSIDDEFIKDEPLVLINDENFLKLVGFDHLDCMVSVNSNEGGNVLMLTKTLDSIFNTTLTTSLLFTPNYRTTLIRSALKLYFGATSPDMEKAVVTVHIPADIKSNTLDPQVIFDTAADPQIVVPTIAFAKAHAELTNSTQTGKKTYMYLFDQSPSFLPRKAKGLIHGEDIYFTLGLPNATIEFLNLSMPTRGERELANTLMDIITEFARYGNPSPAVSPKLSGGWPEFTVPKENYLRLNTHMTIASKPFQSSMSLWTETLPQLLDDWEKKHHDTSTTPHHTNPKPDVIG